MLARELEIRFSVPQRGGGALSNVSCIAAMILPGCTSTADGSTAPDFLHFESLKGSRNVAPRDTVLTRFLEEVVDRVFVLVVYYPPVHG